MKEYKTTKDIWRKGMKKNHAESQILQAFMALISIFSCLFSTIFNIDVARALKFSKKVSVNVLFILMLCSSVFAVTVSHPAAQVTNGTFGAGNFAFQNNVTVDGNVGIGTTGPRALLHVPTSAWASTPIFERSGQTSDALWVGARILTTKTSDMGNGFGSAIEFMARDDAGVDNELGIIGAVRTNNDDDTGDIVFLPVTNSVGNERMRITYGGNVGIGTTGPRTKLEVDGDLPTSIPTYTNTVNGMTVGDGGDIYARLGVANLVGSGAGYPTYLQAGDWSGATYYNLLLNPNGGNVGIGTTEPAHLLHIKGNDATIILEDSDGIPTNASIANSDEKLMFQKYGVGAVMTLNLSSGNVGIGTTSPSSTFHIKGTTDNVLKIDQHAPGGTLIQLRNSSGNGKLDINLNSAGVPIFYDYVGGSWKSSIALNNGNVGIGITNPTVPLDVAHNIRIEEDVIGSRFGLWLNGPDGGAAILSGGGHSNGIGFYTASNLSSSKMAIDPTGNVGIGDFTPDYKLDVNGTICQDTNGDDTCDGTVTSDLRLKENITNIDNALNRIQQLNGVQFYWNESANATEHLGRGEKQIGLIAQDVEKEFPELVYEDMDGYKMVDYQKLTAPLIEAVKELKAENEQLKKAVCELNPDAEVC